MKSADVDTIIKAIETRHKNEDIIKMLKLENEQLTETINRLKEEL